MLDFSGALNTYNESPNGEIADARAFREDWKAVGDDMRRALEAFQNEQKCESHG